MKPNRTGRIAVLWLLTAWLGGGGATFAADGVGELIAEGRIRSRQMRYSDADALLRRALTLGGTPDQSAFAELMLGVVAHQRRELAAAKTHYRTALEHAGSAAIRSTAQENLDLLAADRARFDSYRQLGDRLDHWLIAEVAGILLIAAAFFRFTRRTRVSRVGYRAPGGRDQRGPAQRGHSLRE